MLPLLIIFISSESINMNYNDFVSKMIKSRMNNKQGGTATDFLSTFASFNLTEVTDNYFTENETYYIVTMTPNQQKDFEKYNQKDKNLNPSSNVYKVKLITKYPIPSDVEMSNFWIILIVILLGISFLSFGFYIWATDDYPNDPQNSLIFATDGQKLVKGD